MKPDVQRILTKLSEGQTNLRKINLSVITNAKKIIREVGDEIDFVDKLQNKIMDDIQRIEKIASDIKSAISDLDGAKQYKPEVKSSMSQIRKAADELGADFKNIQEYKMLDSSIDLIDGLDGDNKRIKQDAKKYIK